MQREEPNRSRFSGRACDPVGDPGWSSLFLKDLGAGAVREELHPVGRTHVGEVCAELSPVGGTFMLEQGQSVRSPPLRRKQQQRQRVMK